MKSYCLWALLALLGAPPALRPQTLIDLRTQTKSIDFSSASTKPFQTGTVLPETCSIGEAFFNSAAPAGHNLFLCSVTDNWTEVTGLIASIFGRTGALTAQAGDYTYAQISNTPSALPPNGTASGDLSGAYPNPTVARVSGAAIPTSGVLKANSSRQIVAAVPGTDYESPLTFTGALSRAGNAVTCNTASGAATGCLSNSDWSTFNGKQNALTNPITGTGTVGSLAKFTAGGTVASGGASDIVNLFSGCSGTQYLGADGACHTSSGGSGNVVLTTGSGAPSSNCAAPSSSNLALYLDTTNNDAWWCFATNSWKKTLSVTGSGPYQATGATGSVPSTPASGMVTCYFDSTLNTQVCLDPSGNAWQMVKETTVSGLQKRSCDIAVGDASSSNVVTNVQLGPQKRGCKIPSSATVLEVDVESDAGSPSVVVGRRRCTAWAGGVCSAEGVANLISAALASAAGFMGCSNAGGATGADGGTTCSATLQNAGLSPGDWIELVSGTAGGTAKLITIHILYQVN